MIFWKTGVVTIFFFVAEDTITISVWNDKKIHSKKDGGVIKMNNAGAFLGCVKLLSNAIQRLKDTGTSIN